MGRCKQLLPINGETAIALCLCNIMTAAIEEVVVVAGHNHQAVLAALEGLPVRTIINRQPESQMADSARLGLAAMPQDVSGILVALCDHPLVLPGTYLQLRQAHEQFPERIIQPHYQGRGGHPTLFPRSILREVRSGTPMNRIMASHPFRILRLEIDDPGLIHDMDYEADYQRLLALAANQTATAITRNQI